MLKPQKEERLKMALKHAVCMLHCRYPHMSVVLALNIGTEDGTMVLNHAVCMLHCRYPHMSVVLALKREPFKVRSQNCENQL
jgi:hypothetical protein